MFPHAETSFLGQCYQEVISLTKRHLLELKTKGVNVQPHTYSVEEYRKLCIDKSIINSQTLLWILCLKTPHSRISFTEYLWACDPHAKPLKMLIPNLSHDHVYINDILRKIKSNLNRCYEINLEYIFQLPKWHCLRKYVQSFLQKLSVYMITFKWIRNYFIPLS